LASACGRTQLRSRPTQNLRGAVNRRPNAKSHRSWVTGAGWNRRKSHLQSPRPMTLHRAVSTRKQFPGLAVSLSAHNLEVDSSKLAPVGRVVTNRILPTSKRKGWCCHDPSLLSFIPSIFAIGRLFRRSSVDSLRRSLTHNTEVGCSNPSPSTCSPKQTELEVCGKESGYQSEDWRRWASLRFAGWLDFVC
jgi:hypothetical protein